MHWQRTLRGSVVSQVVISLSEQLASKLNRNFHTVFYLNRITCGSLDYLKGYAERSEASRVAQ
jgi:hypothetical protein